MDDMDDTQKIDFLKQALEYRGKQYGITNIAGNGSYSSSPENHNKLKLVEGKSLDLEEIKAIIKEIKEQMTLAMDRLEALELELK